LSLGNGKDGKSMEDEEKYLFTKLCDITSKESASLTAMNTG
jgi:hypothetical protein